MDLKRHLLEAATLIAAAVVCALAANAVAGRERKVAVIGQYSSATKVQPEPATTPAPLVTPAQSAPTQTIPTVTIATATQQPNNPVTQTTTATQTTATRQPGNPATATPRPRDPATPPPATGNQPPATHRALATAFPPHPDKPYVEIHGDDVAYLYQQGALFLDARRTSVYEQGHIAGSRPFSVWESDVADKVNALFNERGDPKQAAQPIVVYCSGGDCEDSHMLAERLSGAFTNVYVYKDGFPDWQKRGGAVHTGSNP
jgi:rhodanese-related sulfurtransferase